MLQTRNHNGSFLFYWLKPGTKGRSECQPALSAYHQCVLLCCYFCRMDNIFLGMMNWFSTCYLPSEHLRVSKWKGSYNFLMISWNLLWTLLNQLNRAPKPHDSFFKMKSAIATPPRPSRSLQSVMQKIKLRWKQERFWKLLCCKLKLLEIKTLSFDRICTNIHHAQLNHFI